MITCCWCNKKYNWDYDQDEIITKKGKVVKSVLVTVSKPRDIQLSVYLCTCGGTLAAVTLEPKGSTLLEYNPKEDHVEDT